MPPQPLSTLDWDVLARLEDCEQELINFGIYEPQTAPAALVPAPRSPVGAGPSEADVRAALDRLCEHFQAVQVGADRYRSRIAEIVRILKNVKQRFAGGDAAKAPFLVQSIRVRFRDRNRLNRAHPANAAFGELFQANRTRGLEKFDTARQLVLAAAAEVVGRTVTEFMLTGVQRRALKEIGTAYLSRQGGGFAVTGNTGSGKTEAVLYPLLVGALQERFVGKVGCKVLLVYPRQALARNQLDRLVQYLARLNARVAASSGLGVADRTLSVGILFGDTPEDDSELGNGRTSGPGRPRRPRWEPAGGGVVLPYFRTEDDQPVIAVPQGNGRYRLRPAGGTESWALDGFRATRAAIRDDPPDLLVLTTEMLHRWLSTASANRLFGVPESGRAAVFCPPRAIVFDEIHLYDTTHGAQIGGLLRRLRNRMYHTLTAEGAGWQYPLVVGMSATLGDSAGFWQRLCGVPVMTAIDPTPTDFGPPQGRDYFLFVRPETYSRGRRVGDASAAIQTVMAVAHNMTRRAATDRDPSKHRSLVFLDSIGKVRKLAVEFRDAETNLRLSRFRLAAPPGGIGSAEFADGEYWYFDQADSLQFGENRPAGAPPAPLTSADQPVYSANGRTATEPLQRDIVFSTTALEVGYDDPSIQFVLQHHAPRTPASFVQKRGRAGRAPADRPITAVTLSRTQFKDAFYFANPALLYDPADYTPPLNVDNYFVQRFQSLALVFDELARLTGRDWRTVPADTTPDAHAAQVEAELNDNRVGRSLEQSYPWVATEGFRRVVPGWRTVWAWFRGELADAPPAPFPRNVLEVLPILPRNLFGSVNLPTVAVGYNAGGTDDPDWDDRQEDIALVLSEVAPGKVTRRYGPPWRHLLFWRPPSARVVTGNGAQTVHGVMAVERYQVKDNRVIGPFDPARLQSLAAVWGPDWAAHFPDRARRLYDDAPPDRFYRLRSVQLYNFGTLNPAAPRDPQPDWLYAGERTHGGGVRVIYDADGSFRQRNPRARRVSAESVSYPLSFAVVRRYDPQTGLDTVPGASVRLPPLFPGLADTVEGFFGEVGASRSVLRVHEAHYGAEATIKLIPQGQNDRHAGHVPVNVRYVSEHDGRPVLYGHDLTTEGVRVGHDPAALGALADSLATRFLADDRLATHYQDQFFRYLLKTRPWPGTGVADPVNLFDARTLADLLATARAEARATGRDLDQFLGAVTTADGLWPLVHDYWRDHRLAADENFIGRVRATLTGPGARSHLAGVINEVRVQFRRFLGDVILHSLEQAVRNLFLVEGSTRDEEVGTHAVLWLAHGRTATDPAVYAYERNQDGNGATRLLLTGLHRPGGYPVRRWWGCACGCPVGDEEDFVKHVLRSHRAELLHFAAAYRAAPAGDKPSPRALLESLISGYRLASPDDPAVGRVAGALTGELTFAGASVPYLELVLELLALEDELTARFQRPPVPGELAGFAATRTERQPAAVPHLRRLYELYRDHAAELGWDPDDESAAANPLDRFLAQVEQLGLITCTDACPACLAGRSAHGPLEVTRHLVSRRVLLAASELLSAPFTRPSTGVSVDDLTAVARAGGWLVLDGQARPTNALARELEHRGIEQLGEFVVFGPDCGPRLRSLWRTGVQQ
jgi:hypothetical protein